MIKCIKNRATTNRKPTSTCAPFADRVFESDTGEAYLPGWLGTVITKAVQDLRGPAIALGYGLTGLIMSKT